MAQTTIPATELKEYNVATVKGAADLNAILLTNEEEFCEQHCDLLTFLKTLEKPRTRYHTMPLFYYPENTLVIVNKDRALYTFRHHITTLKDGNWMKCVGDDESPVGIIITDCQKRTEANKSFRVLCLLNADDQYGSDASPQHPIVDKFTGCEMPIVSFECLAQFWDGNVLTMARRLTKGEVKLLDYTPDEGIELTAPEKRTLKKTDWRKYLKSPRLGFSLINYSSTPRWHRSGTCLFHDTKKDRYLLFGQDENTYFGCELPSAAKTVAEAFDVLTPNEVKDKVYERQGEWFAVEVSHKDVPAKIDCALLFEGNDNNEVFLPKEEDGKAHSLRTDDGRVGKDGRVYVYNCHLDHEDHQYLELKGWHTFYRNTALRSVSQEGVD